MLFAFLVFGAQASESNPLGSVLDLMAGLAAKITKEGEAEARDFKEYFEWCDDVSKNKNFQIETAKSDAEKLEAKIGMLTANIQASSTKIEELAADISTSDADLKAATEIRDKEAADFAASEKELVETIDTLHRAVSILEREMQKNPAAFAQVASNGLESVLQSLSVVVDAAAF